jgi:hypothetical protein
VGGVGDSESPVPRPSSELLSYTLLPSLLFQIADKIVNMVATYASKAALTAIESTGTICTALSRFPENIEQLTSTREFQATVPEKVHCGVHVLDVCCVCVCCKALSEEGVLCEETRTLLASLVRHAEFVKWVPHAAACVVSVCRVMWYGGEQVAEISASIVDVRAAYALLSEFKVQLSRDRLELEWEAYRGPQRIAIKMAEVGHTPSWSRVCVPFCLFEPLSVGGRGCHGCAPWSQCAPF